MTHAFSAQFVLLTQGSKVGASFAEKLNLFKKKAVNMYRRYPEEKCGKVTGSSMSTTHAHSPDVQKLKAKQYYAAMWLCQGHLESGCHAQVRVPCSFKAAL